MSGEGRLDIAYLISDQAGDPGLMPSVTGLINKIYAVARRGFGSKGRHGPLCERSSPSPDRQRSSARMDGDAVGCVRIQ